MGFLKDIGIACANALLGVVMLIFFIVGIAQPSLFLVVLGLGYAMYRINAPGMRRRREEKQRQDAENARRRSEWAAQELVRQQEMARHIAGLRVLAIFAMSDDRLSKVEVEIMESYYRTGPGHPIFDMRKWAKSHNPSSNDRVSILDGIKRDFSAANLTVLVEHIQMLRDTKRRHAPLVEQWFDDTMARLGVSRPIDPYDIRPA